MKNNINYSVNYSVRKVISALLAVVVLISAIQINKGTAYADNNQDKVVVVSLGDSYSSGEGIEPFYGQEKSLENKVKDLNWLAHRSTKSWPGLLEIPGISETMKDYWSENTDSTVCKWYFAASSGAKTKHITTEEQKKEYDKKRAFASTVKGTTYLPKQLDIFNQIEEDVDYVTLTIGGNDVDFSGIITDCVTGSTYLKKVPYVGSKLEKKLNALWENFDEVEANLKNTYTAISNKAGSQAKIIVAGYPKLLNSDGKGAVISKEEATIVNENVSRFNDKIESIIEELKDTGINIYFVDVEAEFDKDGGHQAYSKNAWINKVILGSRSEDLKTFGVASAYSIHPNAKGAEAYARCVNAKIAELEKYGQLEGKVCKASDRITPIKGALVQICKNGIVCDSTTSDEYGNYSISVPAGEYQVDIYATNYISFTSYTEVTQKNTTYMETFLMVAGDRFSKGIAKGTISNALTGIGEAEVKLSVRRGWNNLDKTDVLETVYTDANGNYSVNLPYGNYTLTAEKSGYVTTPVNIIVQKGTTASQNGTISPALSGSDFRIVLTWGANPRDLDSHMKGRWLNGNDFHVYFAAKGSYGYNEERCVLDVDDTTSYGPETITLNAPANEKYYYYIHKYSGSGTLSSSEAQIKVYQAGKLVAIFNVPSNMGSGNYWNVFVIENGQIIPKNTITTSPDTAY